MIRWSCPITISILALVFNLGLAPAGRCEESDLGAESPEALFQAVRESLADRDWPRYRALVDRTSFERGLEAMKRSLERRAAEEPKSPGAPTLDQIVRGYGFAKIEELLSADLDLFLDRALPSAFGAACAKIVREHAIVRMGAVEATAAIALVHAVFERIEADGSRSGVHVAANCHGRRCHFSGLEPDAVEIDSVLEEPAEAVFAEKIKARVLRSFRLAPAAATEIGYVDDAEKPTGLVFALPRRGSVFLPKDASGVDPAGAAVLSEPAEGAAEPANFSYKIEISKGAPGRLENLYRVVVHVYRQYDPALSEGGRADDRNKPAHVVSTMVTAN